MSRKAKRVPYQLDAKGIESLSTEEIAAILRGADDLIMVGGRTLLAKILKGSKEKRLLERSLDSNPVYGYYRDLPVGEVQARIDWVILEGYLAIKYDYRLPLLVYTARGWEIEKETYATELLAGFDALLEAPQSAYDMSYLRDRERGMILLLLDKVEATNDPKYIPILDDWASVDYKKVKPEVVDPRVVAIPVPAIKGDMVSFDVRVDGETAKPQTRTFAPGPVAEVQ